MTDRKYTIFMLGTAGSGKTFLTRTLYDWFSDKRLDVAILNLDAGVKRLPYNPNIDVRDLVDIDNIIEKFNLGPNGAMIASMDFIASNIHELKSEIDYLNPQYLLIDTPGQMELFAYRSSGQLVSSILAEESQPVSIFMIDPSLALRPEGFASVLLLAISVEFQLSLPQILALSKVDIIDDTHMEKIESWIDSTETLSVDIQKTGKISLAQQLGLNVLQLLEEFKITGEIFPISASTGYNIDNLIAQIEREFGKRDDFYE